MFRKPCSSFMLNTSSHRSQPELGPNPPRSELNMRQSYQTHSPYWWQPLLAAAALMTGSVPTVAQIATSRPPPGTRAHEVIPGERYRVGGLHAWLFGSDYRVLWTTAVEATVLDLDSVGGGLTPLRTGGFGQSVSLHFEGADGRRYVVRSIDKDPTKRMLPDLRGTVVEGIIQDQISALHPTGALVVDPLLDATGVLHARHRMVVIPDDPRLGEFRDEFAGMLGMLLLHPDEGADNTPGFAGSRQVNGTDTFLRQLEESPCDRVDARSYLKARLLDMLIGDRDRHAGQWRWARFADEECGTWAPIPEDRDQAFVDYDGLVNWVLRRPRPQQITFGSSYPSLTGLTFNGWELDRELLAELDQAVWDSLASATQRQLTDDVIENAVRRLPPTHYDLNGEFLTNALKQRRDRLPEEALKYYRLISRWVEVKATDEDEYAEFEHKENGELDLKIGLEDDGSGERAEPYFQRTFDPETTLEVRLYLRGGDDNTEVLGGRGKITIRVDGGAGDDRFVNASQAGGGRTRFYDSRGDNQFEAGRGAKVNTRSYERPPAKDQAHEHALDWGGRTLLFPRLGYAPDPGLYLAAELALERYGYRKNPYKTRHRFLAGLVTNGPRPVLGYAGSFRHVLPEVDAEFRFAYTGLAFLRFNGFGNGTQIPGPPSFYEVEQRNLLVAPTLAFRTGRNRGGQAGSGTEPLREELTVDFSLLLKHWNTPLDENADVFIGTIDPPLYGTGSFGQVGARVGVEVDTRDNSGNPRRGVLVTAAGAIYPGVWDVESTFGEVHGSASTYLTAQIPTRPTLALRAGGKKVWGDVPFLEAAYIGGGRNLRGYRSRRYAGNAAVYGNAELRFSVAPFKILVPGTVGLFALTDVGRVFYQNDPADANAWHVGYGGGLWISVIGRMQTLSVAIAKGDDLTGVYISAGFMY